MSALPTPKPQTATTIPPGGRVRFEVRPGVFVKVRIDDSGVIHVSGDDRISVQPVAANYIEVRS